MDFVGLGGFITIVGTTVVLIIKTVQMSRCTKIDCCCMGCERDLNRPFTGEQTGIELVERKQD